MKSHHDLPSHHIVLGTQLIFNIGFYAVVPFIALYMREDMGMGATMIGLVLGARTFAQQGMFALGGWLAHQCGYRLLMMAGCALRVLGYIGLAMANEFSLLLISAIFTGLGGAMFSPCLEAMIAEIKQQGSLSIKAKTKKSNLFARFAVAGEFGAVAGPLLGGWLMRWGFSTLALICAGLFAVMALVLYRQIPGNSRHIKVGTTSGCWREVFGNRAFLAFCAAYSSYLFCYNQLYMALPAEITRINAPQTVLSWLFVLASLMIIVLQMPISRWFSHWAARYQLALGFMLMACGFCGLMISDVMFDHDYSSSFFSVTPAIVFVICLSLGQMLAVPVAMSLIPHYAVRNALPLYYGILASAGGGAVLAGNVVLGLVQDWQVAYSAIPTEFNMGWLVAMLLPLASTAYFLRSQLPGSGAEGEDTIV